MPGAEPPGRVDEFEAIARLLRPLTGGAPEALGLMDDAAVIPGRPGFDLVVSNDAMVEGVHFLAEDPLEMVARKLLRVNLSDLAAKAAEPYGYFLAAAWPPGFGWSQRERFAEGLAQDQAAFGLTLLGGDTTSTPGPLTLSLTILGWAPQGRTVLRSTARAGDRILVSGTIGDGFLGLMAAQGRLPALEELDQAWLADRYRLPSPRTGLRDALRAHAAAAADVSDGLLADAGHIGEASGAGLVLHLDRLPLSESARAWLSGQPDQARALARLATGGDDYEVVCAARPDQAAALAAAGDAAGLMLTDVGEVVEGQGTEALHLGRRLELQRTGWTHG